MTEEFTGRPGRGMGRGHRHHQESGHGRGRGRAGRSGRHSLLAVRLVEPAVLVLVAEEARHGYTLLEELEKLGLKDLHPSKVYRTLRMMEDDLWIVSDWDADETQGPPRRVYRLTEEGKDVLCFWQKRLEENQQVVENILTRLREQPEQ
ncbi:MAG: hypothetical protein CL609_03860 [Anaerolineaceae bacterium]|nr:hypothetical protein [Anaerolineaceae bacterium]